MSRIGFGYLLPRVHDQNLRLTIAILDVSQRDKGVTQMIDRLLPESETPDGRTLICLAATAGTGNCVHVSGKYLTVICDN